MQAVEEFLAGQQRYDCERLRATLTVAQCEANRKREPVIFQCSDCAGLGKAIEMEERMNSNKCKCGGVIFSKSSGECRPCYDKRKHGERKARKAGDEIKAHAVSAAPPVPQKRNPLLPSLPAAHILLDLSDRPSLFAWLEQNSVTCDEIIELLNECYRGNVRWVA